MDVFNLIPKYPFDCLSWLITEPEPYDLRRRAQKRSEVGKIAVLRYNCEAVFACMAEDEQIVSGVEAQQSDLGRAWEEIG